MRTLAPLAALLLALAPIASAQPEQQQLAQQQQAVRGGTVELDFGPARVSRLRRNRKVEVAFKAGMTALDALKAAAKVTLTEADPTHPAAIDAIDGVKTDLKKNRFWILDVNGAHATTMAQEITLEPGFSLKMAYKVPPVVVVIDFGPAGRDAKTAEVKWRKGMTALDALKRAAKVEMSDADPLHPAAVSAVDGVKTDLAKSRFWLFDVNQQHPDKMADKVEVKPGFDVKWYFSEWKADASHGDPVQTTQAPTGQAPSVGMANALPGALPPK